MFHRDAILAPKLVVVQATTLPCELLFESCIVFIAAAVCCCLIWGTDNYYQWLQRAAAHCCIQCTSWLTMATPGVSTIGVSRVGATVVRPLGVTLEMLAVCHRCRRPRTPSTTDTRLRLRRRRARMLRPVTGPNASMSASVLSFARFPRLLRVAQFVLIPSPRARPSMSTRVPRLMRRLSAFRPFVRAARGAPGRLPRRRASRAGETRRRRSGGLRSALLRAGIVQVLRSRCILTIREGPGQ